MGSILDKSLKRRVVGVRNRVIDQFSVKAVGKCAQILSHIELAVLGNIFIIIHESFESVF